jgi:hypothetical protein
VFISKMIYRKLYLATQAVKLGMWLEIMQVAAEAVTVWPGTGERQ